MKMLWNNRYVTGGWIVELGATRMTEFGPFTLDKAGAQRGRIASELPDTHALPVLVGQSAEIGERALYPLFM